jgi:hypothetical protein
MISFVHVFLNFDFPLDALPDIDILSAIFKHNGVDKIILTFLSNYTSGHIQSDGGDINFFDLDLYLISIC